MGWKCIESQFFFSIEYYNYFGDMSEEIDLILDIGKNRDINQLVLIKVKQ